MVRQLRGTQVHGLVPVVLSSSLIPQNGYRYANLCITLAGGPALTLLENSFIKYRLPEDMSKRELKLSLRLRTFSNHGTVMFAKGHDYSILEVSMVL